jgi:hypothetical protein
MENMKNPFKIERDYTPEDVERLAEVTKAFDNVWEVMFRNCKVPSRYHSIAVTLLELAYSVAVKSISKEILP